METPTHQVSRLLQAWASGDQDALPRLVPFVYAELHRLARRYMSRERPGHTLQTTALVNEAYLRLVDSPHPEWHDRAYFFAICSHLMRRILVDWARSRGAVKRGGRLPALQLEEALIEAHGNDLVAVDEALTALAEVDARKARVVELRFFGGLGVRETAQLLKISPETVMRDWRFAKSWLRHELSREYAAGH